ncbi:MAG: shikimate dehydrogenase [Rhodospirillales bacterium]|jgi:shikimate dehydrogenase|nr:shikimate dehydrogenase [Rhodospirillales bacterium]
MTTGRAKLAGVMGWPVGHSLSPLLHGYWLTTHAIDGAYIPLAVKPDDFADAVRMLPKLGFAGANVTIPHKQAAMACVDELDDVAVRIGAVNTIVVRRDGRLWGTNTDGYGFLENLKAKHPQWDPQAGPAAVIGAGGAARAVVVALLDAGVASVRLTNRSRERAEGLARDVDAAKIEVIDWDLRSVSLAGAGLLVNTTSLGMTGQPALELDLTHLPKEAAVYDIVYVPLDTDLLKAAKAAGHPTIDGIGMLLHQARPGFAAWFGIEPTVDQALTTYVLTAAGAGT